MSTQPAPPYNPEPFNPNVYENIGNDLGNTDYIDNATLDNCTLDNCTLNNSYFTGSNNFNSANTFQILPSVPSTAVYPQFQNEFTTKQYVDDAVATPLNITITDNGPSFPVPPASGIRNYYNTGGIFSYCGSGTSNYLNNWPCATTKIVIDSKLLSTPQAKKSLFRIQFLVYNGANPTTFYQTKFDLQLYPNRLWNNTIITTAWYLNNKINGNSNYQYTDQNYAPNGRWYWTFNQQFSNLGGTPQGFLVPQQDKVNIFFGIPSADANWEYEYTIECLDASDMITNNTNWLLRNDALNNW